MKNELRSLLLTFDSLAPKDVPCSPHTVTLQQHYHVTTGWQAFLREPGDSKSVSPAEQTEVAHQEDSRRIKRVIIGATNESSEQCELDDQVIFAQATFVRRQDVQFSNATQWLPECSPQDVLWIHTRNSGSNDAKIISDLVSFFRQARSDNGLMVISGRTGQSNPPLERPFDVLVEEESLRAPAFVEHPAFSRFSLQTLTGSHDLLSTLILHAGGAVAGPISVSTNSGNAEGAIINPDGTSIDLRTAIREPGRDVIRNLRLQAGNVRAIRNNDFLYAAVLNQDSSSGLMDQEGLFEKPQDYWNVHDVSNEYLEITDRLRNEIGLT